jgi:hypothetical protein
MFKYFLVQSYKFWRCWDMHYTHILSCEQNVIGYNLIYNLKLLTLWIVNIDFLLNYILIALMIKLKFEVLVSWNVQLWVLFGHRNLHNTTQHKPSHIYIHMLGFLHLLIVGHVWPLKRLNQNRPTTQPDICRLKNKHTHTQSYSTCILHLRPQSQEVLSTHMYVQSPFVIMQCNMIELMKWYKNSWVECVVGSIGCGFGGHTFTMQTMELRCSEFSMDILWI